jgi:hypothetical protein
MRSYRTSAKTDGYELSNGVNLAHRRKIDAASFQNGAVATI